MDGNSRMVRDAANDWTADNRMSVLATGWAIALVALAAAVPLLVPPVQALADLPAHLSQYHIVDQFSRSATLRHFYVFAWQPAPNLGVDLLVAGLAPLLGVEPATRLVVAAIPALSAAGMLLVARVAHGGRVPPTSLVALPLAYNYPLTYGFVNSSLSVALALVAFAPWLALTRAGRPGARALFSVAIAPLLFFAHIIGYGVFGLMAGGAALAATWRADRPIASLRDAVLACLPLVWPLVFTLLWTVGTKGTTSGWTNFAVKAKWTIGLLRDGWAPFDVASAAVLLAVATLPFWRRRAFGWCPLLALPALILWLGACCLPTRMMGSEWASVRLLPIACTMSLLAVAPRRPLPGGATIAALAFVAARWIGNGLALLLAGTQAEAKLGALDRVTPGSRVIAFLGVPCATIWAPHRLRHLAAYATVRRDAFVNDDFDSEAGQALHRRRATDPVLMRMQQPPVLYPATCVRDWPGNTFAAAFRDVPWGRFDYLWLLDIPDAEVPRDPRLAEIWRGDGSTLYRATAAPAS